MKLLTKDTDYAVRALLCLAKKKKSGDEWLSSSEISKEERIPLQYLRRILQILKNEGYIESKEGVSGGLRLVKSPEKVKVADLIRLFHGEIEIFNCMFRKKACHNRNKCFLRKRVLKIEKIVEDEFGNITLKVLLDDMGVRV